MCVYRDTELRAQHAALALLGELPPHDGVATPLRVRCVSNVTAGLMTMTTLVVPPPPRQR